MALEIINNKYKNISEVLIRGTYIFIPSIILVIYFISNPIISVENHEIMENYLKTNFNETCYTSCSAYIFKSSIYISKHFFTPTSSFRSSISHH